MKQVMFHVQLRQPKSQYQLRMEHRMRIAENIVTVLLGLGSSAALFWCGWLVGSGAFG